MEMIIIRLSNSLETTTLSDLGDLSQIPLRYRGRSKKSSYN